MNQFLANHLDAIISAIIGLIAGGISVRLFEKKNCNNTTTKQSNISAGGDVAGRDITN
ncbi:hypothetical protein [uncultured Alistipes sp.]|uniref:hypothetical protein n=1 Tax=uncultured Alistipes sp. TaxID=538949 RepID=UPI00259AC0D7|nr:hypothetical protein [uncultured Alistipes sp.]